MRIQDVMAANPAYCTPETTVQEAAQLMRMHDCGALPIVESPKSRRPIGVVTDRDIVVRLIAEGVGLRGSTVAAAMTPEAVTVRLDADVAEATELMTNERVRRLVVVDESGACVGLLSLADVASSTPAEHSGAVLREVSQPLATPVRNR